MSKESALKRVRQHLNRKLGKGVIQSITEQFEKIQAIPTGIVSLDKSMKIGGIPRGRIIEIYGPEQCGKSTWLGTLMAQSQALGQFQLYLDYEHGMDPGYLAHLGVDLSEDKFAFAQPTTFEQGAYILKSFLEIGKEINLGIVGIDSIAGMNPSYKKVKGSGIADNAPESEDQQSIVTSRPGLQSLMLSNLVNNIKALVTVVGATVIGTNQIRSQISTMGPGQDTTPGGHSFKHYASLRINLKRRKTLTSSTVEYPSIYSQLDELMKKEEPKKSKSKKSDPLVPDTEDMYQVPDVRGEISFDDISTLAERKYTSLDNEFYLAKSRICSPFISVHCIHNLNNGYDKAGSLWDEALSQSGGTLVKTTKGFTVLVNTVEGVNWSKDTPVDFKDYIREALSKGMKPVESSKLLVSPEVIAKDLQLQPVDIKSENEFRDLVRINDNFTCVYKQLMGTCLYQFDNSTFKPDDDHIQDT